MAKKAKETLLAVAVAAAFDCAGAAEKMTDAVKALFTGVTAANRDAQKKELYDAIRKTDGTDEEGKLLSRDKLTPNTRRAYDSARQAYSRLFPGKGKGKGKAKSGKAIPAIKSKGDVGPSLAYWQEQEGGGNIPRILAALKVLGELLPE